MRDWTNHEDKTQLDSNYTSDNEKLRLTNVRLVFFRFLREIMTNVVCMIEPDVFPAQKEKETPGKTATVCGVSMNSGRVWADQ